MKKRTTWIAVGFFLLTHAFAQAAQDVIISVETAILHEKASEDSASLESLNAGTKLRASSNSKNGWYKVRTPSNKVGWVWKGDLTPVAEAAELSSVDTDYRNRNNERERRNTKQSLIFLKASGLISAPFSPSLSSALQTNTYFTFLGMGGSLQGSIRLTQSIRAAARLMRLRTNEKHSVLEESSFDMQFTSTPLLAGLEFALDESQSSELLLTLLGGVSLSNKFYVRAKNQEPPNAYTWASSGFSALSGFIGLSYLGKVTSNFSIFGELGVLYSDMKSERPLDPLNLGTKFRDSDNVLRAIAPGFLAPMFNLGVEFRF